MKSKKSSVRSVPAPRYESQSISIEKISNGYLIRESRDTPKGYQSSTTYSATKPKLGIPVSKGTKR